MKNTQFYVRLIFLHVNCCIGENTPTPSDWWRTYQYERIATKYSFLEYDEDVINKVLSTVKIKNDKPCKVLFYNKKFNVVFFRNDDDYYSYYIDDDGSADKINTTDNESLAQLGFKGQNYIRKNGLTEAVLNELAPEVVLDGGYFWALDSINRKEKQFNMSFDEILNSDKVTDEELILYTIGWLETEIGEGGIGQYFTNGDEKEFGCLIKALKIIGATETIKVIEDGIKRKQKNVSDEEYLDLEEKLDEDYVGLAIQYIKKIKSV